MLKKVILTAAMSTGVALSGLSAAGNYTNTDSVSFTLSGLSNVTFNYVYDDLLYYTFDQGSKAGDRVSSISSLIWTDIFGHQTAIDTTLDNPGNTGTFAFTNLGAGTYTASLSGTWSYQGEFGTSATYKSGGTVGLSYGVTPVPEPGEWALMLSGLGLMGYIARRRKGATAA